MFLRYHDSDSRKGGSRGVMGGMETRVPRLILISSYSLTLDDPDFHETGHGFGLRWDS